MARDLSGSSLNAASTKGSTNSAPFAFHRHQQHSMNFFSAKSPPAATSNLTSSSDSPTDRLSSVSTAGVPCITCSLIAHPPCWKADGNPAASLDHLVGDGEQH